MGQLRTRVFWGDALERAVSTAAQVVLAVIGTDAINLVNSGFTPLQLAGLAVAGFVLSIIEAIAASYTGDNSSASLVE